MFWLTFLDQIFSWLCFCLQIIIKIVRLLLAAVSINGLTHSCLQRPQPTYYFSVTKAIFRKYLKEEYQSKLQLYQMFREFMIISKGILENIIGPDEV